MNICLNISIVASVVIKQRRVEPVFPMLSN